MPPRPRRKKVRPVTYEDLERTRRRLLEQKLASKFEAGVRAAHPYPLASLLR
jgi:hypothetical protein